LSVSSCLGRQEAASANAARQLAAEERAAEELKLEHARGAAAQAEAARAEGAAEEAARRSELRRLSHEVTDSPPKPFDCTVNGLFYCQEVPSTIARVWFCN
jgi:hypothetical protein